MRSGRTAGRRSRLARAVAVWLAAALGAGRIGGAAEKVTLSPENFERYAPHGDPGAAARGEAPAPSPGPDPMWGDIVLRNDHLTAVIADTQQHHGRSTSRRGRVVPGRLIGLTTRDHPNDILRIFQPTTGNARLMATPVGLIQERSTQGEFYPSGRRHTEPDRRPESGSRVVFRYPSFCGDTEAEGQEVRFILEDGWRHLLVEVDLVHAGDAEQVLPIASSLSLGAQAAELGHTYLRGGDGARLAWVYDPWFRHGYAIVSPEDQPIRFVEEGTLVVRQLGPDGRPGVAMKPGEKRTFSRLVIPGRDGLEVRAYANDLLGLRQGRVALDVAGITDAREAALVEILDGGRLYAAGHTDGAGRLSARLPPGRYEARVSSLGCGERTTSFEVGAQGDTAVTLELPAPARLSGQVRDDRGRGLPARLLFTGIGDTPTPWFFPATGTTRVLNAIHTPDGSFRQPLPPGRYRVRAMRGPEYDYVDREVTVAAGENPRIEIELARRVDSAGWLSAEFGNRSRVSNAWTQALQRGRVLNLLVEDIRFAPPTEEDIVSTFRPHLAALGAEAWMATVEGANLTHRPRKTYDAQNAFPMPYVRGDQDGGLIQRAAHMLQVWWLAQIPFELNERGTIIPQGGNGKLIQTTPPGIHPNDGRFEGMSVLFDERRAPRDINPGNSVSDILRFYDAMEVQPLDAFLDLPAYTPEDHGAERDLAAWQADLDLREAGRWPGGKGKRWPEVPNRNRDWTRIVNQGYRITGVVNGNPRGNHESGVYRNYVACPAPDLATLDPLTVVEAVRRGRVVMSTGPFLDVRLHAGGRTAGPGDDLAAPGGRAAVQVRVQSSNWATIDEVRVLFNGQVVPALRFTRGAHPDLFTAGVTAFDQTIPLELPADTRVTVMALGTGPLVRAFSGADESRPVRHIAWSNAIFVDADGDGFKPHSPIDDLVGTRLEGSGSLRPGPDGAIAIRLYLANASEQDVEGEVSLRTQPDSAVLTPRTVRYRLAPGAKAYATLRLEVPAGFAEERVRVHAPRSSAGVGRRASALSARLGGKLEFHEEMTPVMRARYQPTWWLPAREIGTDPP